MLDVCMSKTDRQKHLLIVPPFPTQYISIDVRQILYFLAHDFQWDLSVTQLLSFHVGYALDIGVQGGGDVGFCVGYHTSRVAGVRHLFALAHVYN